MSLLVIVNSQEIIMLEAVLKIWFLSHKLNLITADAIKLEKPFNLHRVALRHSYIYYQFHLFANNSQLTGNYYVKIIILKILINLKIYCSTSN